MASNQELFGDEDSSSEDEGNDNIKEEEASPKKEEDESKKEEEPVTKKEEEVSKKKDDDDDDDESDSDDSSVDKNKKSTSKDDENKESSSKPKTGGGNRDLLDSSDDDDDEPEFDDKGAVVGLKSKTLAGAKASDNVNKSAINNKTEMSDDDDIRPSSPLTPKEPPKPSKKLIVQEMTSRPEIKTDNDDDGVHLHMTKLPNLVGIQTEAFDPDTYIASQEEQDFGQACYNLIRWRYKKNMSGDLLRDDDGKLLRESNTRLVQWEDGSYTLHVGNESFQVDIIDSSDKNNGFAGLNGYLYLSQAATYKNIVDDEENQTEKPAGTVLECMGPIQSRLAIRPSSLQSEAHKALTVGIRQKTIKKARIAEFVTEEDPEKLKQERLKNKQDIEKTKDRKRMGYTGGNRGGSRRPRMSRSYLEEEEDDRNFDTTNIRDMKRRTMYDDDDEDMEDYGDDDESDEDDDRETFRTLRPGAKNKKAALSKQKRVDSDDDDEEEGDTFFGGGGNNDDDDDDDEDEVAPKVSKKRPHQGVFEDDDDSD